MRTYILEWDPAVSAYKDEDFIRDIPRLEFGDFHWGVPDGIQARSGDNFYMIRCTDKEAGIVMKGFFTSDPYRRTGLSGLEGEAFYLDLRPTFMVSPLHPKGLLSAGVLGKATPGFRWTGGPSGRELPGAYRPVVDALWDDYEGRFLEDDFEEGLADRASRPVAGIDEAVALASEALFDTSDHDGHPAIIRALRAGLNGGTPDEMVCGFLQEVIRRPGWRPGRIREKGFGEKVIDSLVYLIPADE